MSETTRSAGSLIARAIACGWGYAVGMVAGGMIAGALHLRQMELPPGSGGSARLLLQLLAVSAMLGIFVAPLMLGTAGKFASRWLALAALIFVCLGVNTVIEMRIFTTYLAHGGGEVLLLGTLLGSLACGGISAALLRAPLSEGSVSSACREFFRSRGVAAWAWRMAAAWLAFPVAYFLFGMMAAPFVTEAYRSGNLGLVLPPLVVILKTQAVRSALFLAASLPFVILWRKSRGQMILSLGLAHWALVGLYGLLQANGFPLLLRVVHSVEIGADSFAYAAALAYLLRPRN